MDLLLCIFVYWLILIFAYLDEFIKLNFKIILNPFLLVSIYKFYYIIIGI